MDTLSPDEYQQLALRTEKTPAIYGDATVSQRRLARLTHAALGMCTEAGEVQDALKRKLMYGKPLDRVNIIEECGDLLWYIALALDAVDTTMTEAMARNITKLKARYPDGFTEEAALSRDLDAERAALARNAEPLRVCRWVRRPDVALVVDPTGPAMKCAVCGARMHYVEPMPVLPCPGAREA